MFARTLTDTAVSPQKVAVFRAGFAIRYEDGPAIAISSLSTSAQFQVLNDDFFNKNKAYQTVVKPLSEQWCKMLILLRFVIGIFA